MPASSKQYRDLLWDFGCSAQCIEQDVASESSLVNLRVFSSEDEMFKTEPPGLRGILTEAIPISLPQDWLKGIKDSREDVTPSWLSASVLVDMGRRLWDWWKEVRNSRKEVTRPQPSASELLGVGRTLWEAIPDAAKQPLLEGSVDQPCRLKISSNSPLIDNLPWEWLADATGPMSLRPEVRLARSVPIRLMTPPFSVEPPLRVLLVITNPKDDKLLHPGQEIDAVIQKLQAPLYSVRVLEEPTMEALEEALKEECHIVHYIGHAGLDRGEGNIILQDSRNILHWISGPELSQALPLTVRLLCLSTCFTFPNYQILGLSRLAHTRASYRLPTTVANISPVDEEGVRTFWGEFYSALVMENGNVNEAFHRAQSAVKNSSADNAIWGSFSLVIRDQSGEVFRLEEAGPRTKEKQADEIQAHFASRLANDLARQMEVFGEEAPESLRETVNKEIARAADLTKKVL